VVDPDANPVASLQAADHSLHRVLVRNRSAMDKEKPLIVNNALKDSHAATLPVLEWCEIPEGTVIIESLVYRVKAFKICKYPVTYAQFRVFFDAIDGYFNDAGWKGMPSEEFRRGPVQQQWPIADHPRENVSWYEATAFCRWLGHRLSLPISLPTEQEWQRAARGDDGRGYPWGERFDDTSRANTREKDLRHTTPVTMHPKGVSPYGVWDMGGNVWEWCRNLYEKAPQIGLKAAGPRVLRGGSWLSIRNVTHTTFRYFALPKTQVHDVGFRIVQTPDIERTVIRPDLLLSASNIAEIVGARVAKQIKRFF
jgi:hypothetical protein